MMTWFKNWLKPPVFQDDAKKTHRANILNSVLLSILFFIAILIFTIALDRKSPTATLLIDLMMFALTILLRFWLQRGKVTLVGGVLMLVGLVYVTSINISLGTIRTPSASIYLFFIICTGAVFELPGLLTSTITSSLAILGLILAENSGWLPSPNYSVSLTQWVTYTALFGLTAGLAYQTNQTTRKALARAESEIEERNRIEAELRFGEMRYRSLFEQMHDAVFLIDHNGNCQKANQRAADMFEIPLDELQNLVSKDAKKIVSFLPRMLAGEVIPHFEIPFQKAYGQILPTEMSLELVRNANGDPIHIQAIVRDISERKRSMKELQMMAITDALTGVFNRRHFIELAQVEINRAARNIRPLSLAILDIDHFKQVNDLHGHTAGDQVLLDFTKMVQESVREVDVFARFGGDEFVLLLPETSHTEAFDVVERVRLILETRQIEFGNIIISITISSGISTLKEDTNSDSFDKLMERADQALYKAKAAGRNLVFVQFDSIPNP